VSEAVAVHDVFRVHSTPEGDAAALQGLSLAVAEGELLAVLGPSGSGKTTLLRVLAGLERPSAGSVRVFGADVVRMGGGAVGRYRAATLGYVDQSYATSLEPQMPAVEAVALRLRATGEPRRVATQRAAELLERVGLDGRAEARPRELSGGEQQRLAVCAAVAHRPRLLLADEPTGELDRANAESVFSLLAELAHEHGTTAIVVSHDPRAGEHVDRAIRIRDGRVSEELVRAGGERIVVGRGGWLRLPEDILLGAGVQTHASAVLRGAEIVITGDTPPAAVAQATPATRVEGERVLEVRRLSKSYGDRVVLNDISAGFDGGELWALTGPSGSGKTTFLDLAAGMASPDGGAAVVEGRDIAALDRSGRAQLRRERIGYVPQQPVLLPFLSARENVELGLLMRGQEATAAAIKALEAVGLHDRTEQRVERLSGGERLRVAIARAVAPKPSLLLADEPTARLDEANARAVAALFARLAHTSGAAVLVASHDPVLIEQRDKRLELG
jgi:ABC-type lipoprotein export system ATPase subunit